MKPKEKVSDFSKQAEATLIKQAQAGCQESVNLLLLRYERLVHLVVRRQWLCTVPYEVAVQQGRYGLWHAILGYNPERKCKFTTYAYPAIMRYVWGSVKSYIVQLRREVPQEILQLYFYEAGPDPAKLQDWKDVRESLLELVGRLPSHQAEVMRWHYGLDGQVPQTLEEIGSRKGISHQRVSQLKTAGLVWLRQPAHSQELRSLLARHSQQQYELADELAQVWLRRRGGRNGKG